MRKRFAWYCGLVAVVLLCLSTPCASVWAKPTDPAVGNYVPDEILVKLNASVNVRVFAASHRLKSSLHAGDQLDTHAIYHLKIADGSSPLKKAVELAGDPQVLYAEPNYIGALPEARQRGSWVVGGDTFGYTAQWGLAKMQLPQAHTITRGAGITIALLDTGVDLSHPALMGRLVPGYDFVDNDDNPSEELGYAETENSYGHGTHVAGLLALAAPEAMIMPLRTLNPEGLGTIWAQAQALQYAVAHGADVINLSYSFNPASRLMDDILAEITCSGGAASDCSSTVRPGAIVVAAAGNSGLSDREYPAADTAPGILAVGASTKVDTTATFSTYGSWVRVMAPGDHILSAIPGGGYATWSGTSMATPLAAGTAALVRAIYPFLRPSEVATWITRTATPTQSNIRRRVDAAAAVGLYIAK